jgi:hypothetical protein
MSASAPAYVRYTVLALAAVLIVTLAWRGVRWTMHDARDRVRANSPAYAPSSAQAAAERAALWQRDFTEALDIAVQNAGAGNFTAAEIAVDRAESLVTAARLQGGYATSDDFFAPAIAQLDAVITNRPDDPRLLEHVTLARISLAELRSALSPKQTLSLVDNVSNPGVVQISAPREMSANQTLGPKSFGGSYLDATLMPDTAEILLPPFSRAFSDNIRVANLTIAGAAQTLDGIRWRNVTFVGTRLRYEGGELDLQNVQFDRCRFGFTTDDRGARLANAIALAPGQTVSITIE